MKSAPPEPEHDHAFDRNAFVVPVERVSVRLFLSDGSQHDVVLPRGPGQPLHEVFEGREPFLPAQQGGKVRLYARSALACLAIAAKDMPPPERQSIPELDPDMDDLPLLERSIRVQLQGGVVLEGAVHYVPVFGRGRVSDVMNEPSASFELHVGNVVHHVAKVHVLTVDEC
jgi:hypothetical protein